MYSIEFHLKILEILKVLNEKSGDFCTVSDIFKEYEKNDKVSKRYKDTLKKRIRNSLLTLNNIDKIEKIEVVEKKTFLYKFKIKQ